VSTIQFVAALQELKEDLSVESSDTAPILVPAGLVQHHASSSNVDDESLDRYPARIWTGKYDVMIPRSKPLSPGELLGCTAPRLADVDALM